MIVNISTSIQPEVLLTVTITVAEPMVISPVPGVYIVLLLLSKVKLPSLGATVIQEILLVISVEPAFKLAELFKQIELSPVIITVGTAKKFTVIGTILGAVVGQLLSLIETYNSGIGTAVKSRQDGLGKGSAPMEGLPLYHTKVAVPAEKIVLLSLYGS